MDLMARPQVQWFWIEEIVGSIAAAGSASALLTRKHW
jgi:hypothetical protein